MAKTKITPRQHTAPKAPVIVVEDEEEMASRATPEGEIVEEGKIVAEEEPEEEKEGQAEEEPSQEGDDEEEGEEEAEEGPA